VKLLLKQLELGPLQNFVYMIGSPDTREVAVVDPAWDVGQILDAAEKEDLKITSAIVTHTHFDHINGVEELVEKTDAKVYVHKHEIDQLPLQKGNMESIEGEQEILVGGLTLKVLHTPGHTPGSVCLMVQDNLIAGDTLFIGGCGRCDLPGGDAETLYKSLTRLRKLDDRLTLHPGHNYAPDPTSTIGEEKGRNPFLNAKSLNGFLGLIGQV
jgi:hydroxyacylglutathione hydrolase